MKSNKVDIILDFREKQYQILILGQIKYQDETR